jgi:glycosyltransferase involved in cell wall biosynthesis
MKNLLVSIVTVSKNSAKFIEDNLLSVKHQDYPDIEHIVVDGASTDSTVDILRQYKSVRWISEPDEGFTDAINKGIAMSSGDILAIQNSDDAYYSADAVSKAVAVMSHHPEAGAIFGNCAFVDMNGKVLEYFQGGGRRFNFPALLCTEMTIPLPSAFIRGSALKAAIDSKLECSMVPDWELWAMLGLKFPIVYVPETFGIFRKRNDQASASTGFAHESAPQQRVVLDKIFQNPDLPSEIRTLQKRAYAGTYTNQASVFLNLGNKGKARQCIGTAIRIYPPYLFNMVAIAYLMRALGFGKLVDWAAAIRRYILKPPVSAQGNEIVNWWRY